MRRRPTLLPLDKLIIGARPKQPDAPAASPKESIPLSDKERSRLSALNTKHMYNGPLSPAEAYERQHLLARRQA
jgi:hypothetical protein